MDRLKKVGNTVWNTVTTNIQSIENSSIFLGIMMLVLNIGSRHISFEFDDYMDIVEGSDVIKIIFISSVVFIATKNILVSVLLGVIVYILLRSRIHSSKKEPIGSS